MSALRRRDGGSVLVDALVAVALLAITLTFAAQAVGDGARRTRQAELSRRAVMEASSRMAEVGGDIPLQPGRDQGVDGELLWTGDIAPAAGLTSAGRLLDVTVQAGVPGRPPLVTLHSRRMGPA